MTTPTERKRAERQRRKQAGETRIDVWLDPAARADLALIQNGKHNAQDAVVTAIAYAARWQARVKEGM